MSARDTLITEIVAIVGPDVRVVGVEDAHDELEQVTITVKQRAILPLPAAPIASLRIDYVLTITAPATDPAIAEPALDDFVPSFLDDMRPLSWFGWSEATKTLDGQHMAYDVSAWVIATARGT